MQRLFRIADTRHPIWDGTGAMLRRGRWNSPGQPVIYCAMTYAGAMLEILVHSNIGKVPKMHGCVIADIPDGVSVERHSATTLPASWDDNDNNVVSRAFGDRWLAEKRSAILVVPAVVAKLDFNAVVNPAHPDYGLLIPSAPQAVQWDERLWKRP